MPSSIPPIGIDLGTTNSVVATATDGEFSVLENTRGDRKTPSVVSYDTESSEVYIGKQAKNRAVSDPQETIQSIKRHMGTDQQFSLGPETYRPEEISALILKKLTRDAQTALGTNLPSAVITVPAYFSEQERKATKKAAEIAGLSVDRIITEPTAACLSYGLQAESERTVFVYDLGGGTFDCSVVTISDGMVDVEGVDGATDIGGDDYDGLIVNWLQDQIESNYGKPADASQPNIKSRLFEAAQGAKHELSNRTTTTISLPHLELQNGDITTVEQELDRNTFSEIVRGPTEETLSISEALLENLALSPADIDDVLLVGGSTRMPAIREATAEFFGQPPETGVNPDHVVALGATAQACIIHDKPVPSPSTTNVIPAVASDHGTALLNDGSRTILLDVLPKGIGVKAKEQDTGEEYLLPLLPKGESIPAETQTKVIPHNDYQTHTTFEIYQGDSRQLEDNTKLDTFKLGPYPPKKREEQNHRIKITVDVNGIAHVEAIDENHNLRSDIQVEAKHELSDGDVKSMKSNLPALHE